MSLLRYALTRAHTSAFISRPQSLQRVAISVSHASTPLTPPQTRFYASKKSKDKNKGKDKDITEADDAAGKGGVLSSELVPGSQLIQSTPEYTSTDGKMKAAVDWFRKEVAGMETRASGRVTPALLDPVRVTIKGTNTKVKLEEIATVGVRDGTTLLITVFEEDSLKLVEQALYDAKLPNIVPQKQDQRTIRIPIPKPTVDSRLETYHVAQGIAEDTRVKIRKLRETIIKKAGYTRRSKELDEFQKLHDRHIAEVDKILTDMKKKVGA